MDPNISGWLYSS